MTLLTINAAMPRRSVKHSIYYYAAREAIAFMREFRLVLEEERKARGAAHKQPQPKQRRRRAA